MMRYWRDRPHGNQREASALVNTLPILRIGVRRGRKTSGGMMNGAQRSNLRGTMVRPHAPTNDNRRHPEGMGCAAWIVIGAVAMLGVWVVMTIRGVGI